ncbi:hypothetical protein PENSPDRAFT_648684 [Peniophora sp. CONT]|nr:hypothetical protein PENSPDRAFT_648684 [Peniophora sp. CONT]
MSAGRLLTLASPFPANCRGIPFISNHNTCTPSTEYSTYWRFRTAALSARSVPFDSRALVDFREITSRLGLCGISDSGLSEETLRGIHPAVPPCRTVLYTRSYSPLYLNFFSAPCDQSQPATETDIHRDTFRYDATYAVTGHSTALLHLKAGYTSRRRGR